MPDYRLTFNGDMAGRISVLDDFAKTICTVMASGGQFELSAGMENVSNSPSLVEFVLSPMPLCNPQPALTDEERAAIKIATDFLEDEFYGCSDKCKAEHEAVATLRKLLERLA